MALGVGRFESVSILGFNSPEWLLSNNGAIAAGGFAAGIYTTNEPPACKYIVDHCKARVIVVEGQKQLDKILAIRAELPKLAAIVVYGGEFNKSANDGVGPGTAKVYGWDDFLVLGDNTSDADLQARMDDQKPGHCCTLIYASGTTGNPKAVMISHDNVTWTTQVNLDHTPELTAGPLRVVSYLPLSHIAAQIVDIHSPMGGLLMGLPAEVHFARPDALKGTLKQTLIDAKPTVFFAVPRVWEKFAEAMQAVGKKTTGLKKRMSTWAKGLGSQMHAAAQVGSTRSNPVFGFIARVLLKKPKAALGLDECRVFLSGAAPITMDTLNYFGSLTINIVEVYGMSENTGPQTCGKPSYFISGTCGTTLPGVEIKIDHDPSRDKPGEGEVCFRGRHVMMGYMHNADKTEETVDADGWLHSGDVGKVDPTTNLLGITGRIKELIITAGGENIAPVPIEDRLKSLLPGISNVMMIGDKQVQLVPGDAATGTGPGHRRRVHRRVVRQLHGGQRGVHHRVAGEEGPGVAEDHPDRDRHVQQRSHQQRAKDPEVHHPGLRLFRPGQRAHQHAKAQEKRGDGKVQIRHRRHVLRKVKSRHRRHVLIRRERERDDLRHIRT